jgi:DNA-binding NtrC family response regulator
MFARSTAEEWAPTFAKTARILDLVAIGQRAQPAVPLLIHGEPGTGKDTLARMIHAASPRRAHGFIKVSLAAPSADHHATDLFGHERGGTPQATRRRLGSFEFANHGTLYLDGVGAAPPEHIANVIRAARLGEISRIGGEETIRLDVRLIASTGDNALARAGSDLWQALRSLDAVEICVPPLRERVDEIPILVPFFLERFNRRYRRDVQVCSDLMSSFMKRSWPGNIPELEEAVHRLFVGEAKASVP